MIQGRGNQNSDLVAIGLFVLLILLGWISIYSSEHDAENLTSIFSLSQSSGKQLLWIFTAFVLGILIFVLDYRFFESFAYLNYIFFIILLIAVFFLGREVSGARSWFALGNFRVQPAEFAKYATLLAVAKYLSFSKQAQLNTKELIIAASFFLMPMSLTILQRDAGTAMVYGSLILVLFREGMTPWIIVLMMVFVVLFLLTLAFEPIILIIGISVITLIVTGLVEKTPRRIGWSIIGGILAVFLVVSVNFVMNNVLQSHQKSRIESLLNPNTDIYGIGYQTNQSKIAIGSGGFQGKGFLKGTQTAGGYVPEQTTDFIFCTVGEEFGWVGCVIVISIFCLFMVKLINMAERQKSHFARIFGYGLVSFLFFHFMINISMTIGLFPVIGIPLPFFSYGGSSLWAFSLMFFTFLKLDAHRMQVLQR